MLYTAYRNNLKHFLAKTVDSEQFFISFNRFQVLLYSALNRNKAQNISTTLSSLLLNSARGLHATRYSSPMNKNARRISSNNNSLKNVSLHFVGCVMKNEIPSPRNRIEVEKKRQFRWCWCGRQSEKGREKGERKVEDRKYERFMEHWSLKKNGKYLERGLR